MNFHFPSVSLPKGVSRKDWFNWKWQLRHTLKTKQDFEAWFTLSREEQEGFSTRFSFQSTPYCAQIIRSQANHPLRKVIIPTLQESQKGKQSMKDPLGEVAHSPCRHIIHRYPDRVIFLVTDICPIYCRYCTRKRFTATHKNVVETQRYREALEYIKNNPGIREVILSGGDPLTLSDTLLEKMLIDIRDVSHVEVIRIGSRMPAVCPMRINEAFVGMIKQYHPVFLMSHFNHPEEITAESASALTKLADSGIPVYNQMVLINGLNNHPAIVQALSRRLLYLRARPYYMFQCDPSLGTDHLRTSLKNSQWIQKELWGKVSGLAIPRLSVDLPDGGGKVEVVPETGKPSSEGNIFIGWDGRKSIYIDPEKTEEPEVDSIYLNEWQTICQQNYGSRI